MLGLLAARAALAGAIALSLYLALSPPSEGPGLFPWDKAQHFLCFYVLAGLCAAALPQRPLWLSAALMAAYGLLIEGLQALPLFGRDAELGDWIADLVGIGFCYGPLAIRRWRGWMGA